MTQIATLPAKQRSGALDLFRFLAVLVVFFAHYTDTFNYVYRIVPQNLKWDPVLHYGSTSLLIFFMISGYVVTMTSMKRNVKDFLITRLSRIYPLFWVSCIAAFILPRISNYTYLTKASFKAFLANLTMMPQLFKCDMINPVYHTLLAEMGFYLLITFIIVFKLWDKILLVISLLLLYCLSQTLNIHVSLHAYIPPFLGGMILYLIKINYKSRWKLYILLFVNYFCTLTIGRVLVSELGKFYKDPAAVSVWVMYAIITAIYVLLYLITVKNVKIKSTLFTYILGEIAYPFYLFHIYFLCIYSHFRATIQPDLLLAMILAMVMLLSWALNTWVEKPLSELTKRTLTFIIKGKS